MFSCWIVTIISQPATHWKTSFYFPSFCYLSFCARQTFWWIGRRLLDLFWGACKGMYNCCILNIFLPIVIINQQLTGNHCFCFPSFCILSSCARQTFWLIGWRLWNSFRSKGMYYCCIMKILLLDCHHHPGNSPENIPFCFLLFVFFHLAPGKLFGWLLGCSRPFFEMHAKVCIIAAFWKISCQIVIIIQATHRKTLFFFSLFLYPFILHPTNSLVDC